LGKVRDKLKDAEYTYDYYIILERIKMILVKNWIMFKMMQKRQGMYLNWKD